MRIFSKKAFAFQGPGGEVFTVRPLDFAEAPDWVAKSIMWQWALKDGDVQEVTGKAVGNTAGKGEPGEGKPDEGKPDEEKPDEGKPDEEKPDEGKPDEGNPGEGEPGEGEPGKRKPAKGKAD